MINNHLNQLDSSSKEIIFIAAIYSNNFNIDNIRVISNLDEILIMKYLNNCQDKELINYNKKENNYNFKNDSVRNVLLLKIDNIKKKKYHKKFALSIEKEMYRKEQKYLLNNEDRVEKVAFHFHQSGNIKKAIKYYIQSGDLTKKKYANEKAIKNYLKALKISKDRIDRIEIMIKLGKVYQISGKWREAEKIYTQALNISKEIENEKYISKILNLLSKLYVLKGDLKKSLDFVKKSLKISKELKDKREISKAIENMGSIYFFKGDYIKSLKLYEEKLKISKELKDKREISNTIGNIANIYCDIGNYVRALDYYDRELKICEKLKDERMISIVLANKSNIYYIEEDYNKAMECLKTSLKISKKIGDKNNISQINGSIGNIYLAKGELENAYQSYDQQLIISKQLGDKKAIIRAIGNIGIIYWNKKDVDTAMKYYKESLKISIEIGDKRGQSNALGNIGVIYEYEGNYIKALECYKKKLNICKKIKDNLGISIAIGNLGLVFFKIKKNKHAMEYFEKGLKIAKKTNNSIAITNILSGKIKILIDEKKYKEAKKIINKNIEIFKRGDKKQFFTINILSKKINYILGDNSSKDRLIELLDDSKNDYDRGEILFTLWEIENYKISNLTNKKIKNLDISERKNIIRYASEANIIYNSLLKKNSDIIFKERTEILNNFINKNKIKESFIDDESSKLINSLIQFMNPKTAYLELLKFLVINKNLDSAILLVHEKNEFTIKAVFPDMKSSDIDFSKTIINKVISTKKPDMIENALENNDLKNNPSIIGKTFLSVIVVPIWNKKRDFIGILYVDRKEIAKKPFSKSDIRSVEKIAGIIAPMLVEQEKAYKAKMFSNVRKLGLFIGISETMEKLYNNIENASKVDATVYIHGDTGSGKELVAKAIHQLSDRKDFPFIAINCSAIPKELAESELFGHEKGSFSGAYTTQLGKFQLADKGILFLDEVAELPIEMQAKLLRVLQNNEIWKIGGKKANTVDVRIFVSTHKNLKEEVLKGNFREDLFHRINIIKINVPPLRERKEDIPILAYHFIKSFSNRFNKTNPGFTHQAIEALQSYSYSGNVRELENIIIKALVNHKGTFPIKSSEIFKENKNKYTPKNTENKGLYETLNIVEKKIIQESLEKNYWNISKTAKDLKVDRSQLYRIIKKHKLKKQSI